MLPVACQVTKWDEGALAHLSRTLSEDEVELLQDLRHLYVRWGYRTSTRGEHERFEEATHASMATRFQPYSDLLFRNLEQLDRLDRRTPFAGDLEDKVFSASRTDVTVPGAAEYTAIVQEYCCDPTTLLALVALAEHDEEEDHSRPFVALVVAARALVCWAGKVPKRARKHLEQLAAALVSSESESE